MTHSTAIKQGLEPVFPECHTQGYGFRFFYDSSEGKYYDAGTDLYLTDGQVSNWIMREHVRYEN